MCVYFHKVKYILFYFDNFELKKKTGNKTIFVTIRDYKNINFIDDMNVINIIQKKNSVFIIL